VEILVSLACVSLVLLFALPAVHAAREASRRSTCSHSLRQLGIALHSYIDDNNCFPVVTTNAGPRYLGHYSPQARLLPYLEQFSVFNAINFSVSTFPTQNLVGPPLRSDQLSVNSINETAISTNIMCFHCPSDTGGTLKGGTNYRGNVGVGPAFITIAETPDSGNGLFPEIGTLAASSVPDGLSHTAAFTERVKGSGNVGHPIPQRDVYQLRYGVYDADQLLKGCKATSLMATQVASFVRSGHSWFWTGRERTLYNHAQVPNGRIPDCSLGGAWTAPGMATARSWHPGGVNLLMGDGSLRFVRAGIHQEVWRGLGTRNGNELVD
jgi:prepilin-type processing-associated H-X9-DG protein